MTLRDFKYQPHVTGGSKCLEKHFATWYGNMFLCFEILFPQSLQTCFVWIVTRWSFNHRKHLLCSDTRTASRYIVNKQLCLCLWSLWGWLLPSWVRCQGLSLTFPLHWQSLPESERGFPWHENTSFDSFLSLICISHEMQKINPLAYFFYFLSSLFQDALNIFSIHFALFFYVCIFYNTWIRIHYYVFEIPKNSHYIPEMLFFYFPKVVRSFG